MITGPNLRNFTATNEPGKMSVEIPIFLINLTCPNVFITGVGSEQIFVKNMAG